VADVLDAVHLLLALPLFVVIVGVDPRWLKRSLRERHPELLVQSPSMFPSTSPTDYLEKIFQLTYTLPQINPDNCADLLVAAARETQILPTNQDQRWPDNVEPNTDTTSEEMGPGSKDKPFGSGVGTDDAAFTEESEQPLLVSAEDLAEALTLRDEDIEALREVAPLVSISPRRAKRFLNVYLVVRARALGDPLLRGHLTSNGDRSDSSLLLLVALLLGLPHTMAGLISANRGSDCRRSRNSPGLRG
jgi:hypothetical protein